MIQVLISVALTASPTASVAQQVLEAPFDFVRNQILLEVRLNGAGPYFMFLDTMGDPSVVDIGVARQAGLSVDTTRVGYASGVGEDRIAIYPSEITNLEIGGASLESVQAIAMDLQSIADRLGRPLAGVLGVSFLQGRIVQIDYPTRVVRIYSDKAASPTRRPVGPGWQRHLEPLVLRGTDPLITGLRVNGRPLVVTIDTGSSLTLEVYPDAVDPLGLRDAFTRASPDSVRGARGSSAIRNARVDSLGLGPFVLSDQEVTFAERPSDRGGSLGNGFLKHFVLTIDYQNNLIAFDRKTDD